MPSRRAATHDRRKTNRRSSVPDTQSVPVPPTPVPTPTPTPTPPPVSWSNEPVGLTQLASNQFTTIPPIGQSVAFEKPWYINNGGGATRAPSGAGLVYTYQGGVNQGGGSPATTYFDPSPAPHTLYFRATITVSTPYTPPGNGHNKLLYLGGLYLMLDSGTRLTVETEMSTDNANYPGWGTFSLGVPHVVEWLVDQPNGRTQAWLDGVQQLSAAIKFQSGWAASEPQLYGGYDATAPAQTQTVTYQNVYVSGK